MNSRPPHLFPNWTARQVVLATLVVVAVGWAFWLLFRYRTVVLIFFTAVILGTALRPMVNWFVQHGLPPAIGLTIAYSLLLAGLAAVLFIVVPIIANQAYELAVLIPQLYGNLRTALVSSSSFFLLNIGLNLPVNLNLMLHTVQVESVSADTVSRFLGFSGAFLSGLWGSVSLFLLTSFWIFERNRTLRAMLLIMPPHQRQPVRELFEAFEFRVGAYVRGQLVLCLTIGLLALIAYVIIGLPNALTLALIAGVFEAIPILGPALGAVPALLIAISLNPGLAVWVILSTVIIQGLENYLLVPRIMRASVGVNPIITLLVLATFTTLLGLPGAFLAIPSAAVIQLLLDHFILSADQSGWAIPAGRDINSALRYEVQDLISDVRKQLRNKDSRSNESTDQIEDTIEVLAAELNLLLEQGEQEKTS